MEKVQLASGFHLSVDDEDLQLQENRKQHNLQPVKKIAEYNVTLVKH